MPTKRAIMPTAASTILATALISVGPVSADGLLTWQTLRTNCQSSAADEQAQCYGYIAGAADAASSVCIPQGIKAATLLDLVQTTIDNDDDQRPAVAIQNRLTTIFPCDPDSPPSSTADAQQSNKDTSDQTRSINWSNKERIGK